MGGSETSGRSSFSDLPAKLGKRAAKLFPKRDDRGAERAPAPEEELSHKREWTARHAAAEAGAAAAGAAADAPAAAPAAADPGGPPLFDFFAIVGLPPTTNVRAVSADIRTYLSARAGAGDALGGLDIHPSSPQAGAGVGAAGAGAGAGAGAPGAAARARAGAYGSRGPALPAEVIFSRGAAGGGGLPEGLAAAVAEFCFPAGVRPRLLERTPSMSALNELVYSQPHVASADHSFVFVMQAALEAGGSPSPVPLYGVCCLGEELVHRPPAAARAAFPGCDAPAARYAVAAPRCYCLLSRRPFFELHFRVLHALLGLERLDRAAAFAEEAAAAAAVGLWTAPSPPGSVAAALSGSRSGTEGELTSSCRSSSSDAVGGAPRGRDAGSSSFCTPTSGDGGDGATSALRPASESPPGPLEAGAATAAMQRLSLGSGAATPAPPAEAATAGAGQGPTPPTPFFTPHPGSSAAPAPLAPREPPSQRPAHLPGIAEGGDASPAASPAAAGGGDPLLATPVVAARVDALQAVLDASLAAADARLAPTPGWALASDGASSRDGVTPEEAAALGDSGVGSSAPGSWRRHSLSRSRSRSPRRRSLSCPTVGAAEVLDALRATPVPAPGQALEFTPGPGLQTIRFRRPDAAGALAGAGLPPLPGGAPSDAEAAANLGGWAVAALCRCLSLDNVLAYLSAALLERQVVVFCPSPGLLSACVLALLPMLLPFGWQSLLLPLAPGGGGAGGARLDLLDAPVPFVLGLLHKTDEARARAGALVRVNAYKDRVKNAGGLPPLPHGAALADALAGAHARLRAAPRAGRPVHACSDAEAATADAFLATLRAYLRGLVADLRAYALTDVSADAPSTPGGGARVSVLLRDAYVDSFAPRDRPFVRAFAETQMFSVYCDAVL